MLYRSKKKKKYITILQKYLKYKQNPISHKGYEGIL